VDLLDPRVGAALDPLAARARFRGVRHVAQSEPDDFLLRPDFRRGLGELARRGLTYDLLVYVRQLPAAIDLVRAFPDQSFVLDHLGKPPIASAALEPWASGMRELAASPNVCAKLSGLVTEADWRRWKPSDLAPYVETALEAFGPNRLMLGSDWPVCTVAAGHGATIAVVSELVAELSADERAGLLGGNAARFYGLSRSGLLSSSR
jgi:L-fuconolactonase